MKKNIPLLICLLLGNALAWAQVPSSGGTETPPPSTTTENQTTGTGLWDESNFLLTDEDRKAQAQMLNAVAPPTFNFKGKAVELDSAANVADWKSVNYQDEPMTDWDNILTKNYIQQYRISRVIVCDNRRFEANLQHDANASYNSFEYNPDYLIARYRFAFRKGDEKMRYFLYYYNQNKQISTRRLFRADSLRDQSEWKYLPDGKLISRQDFHIVQASFPRDRASFRWTNDTLRQGLGFDGSRFETVRFNRGRIAERVSAVGVFRFYYHDDGRIARETSVGWDNAEIDLKIYHYDDQNRLSKIEMPDTERIFERDARGLIIKEQTLRKSDGISVYGGNFEYQYEFR